MLEVQKFLKSCIDNPSADSPFDLLSEHYAIKCNFHKNLPLVILNYDQIESPKLRPIVIECRGIVLHTETFEIVCGGMNRFFNLGEALEITENFDWDSNILSSIKEDGSLMSCFNFNGKWLVKTRNSWAETLICENAPSWSELFWSLLPKDFDFSNKQSYIFEMCSMWNQVVRQYPEPKLFLLTVIINKDNYELPSHVVDLIAKHNRLNRPAKIDITNIETVKSYIKNLEETDGTAEGLVLQDKNGLRIKVKSR